MKVAISSCAKRWLIRHAYRKYPKTDSRVEAYTSIFVAMFGKHCREQTPYYEYLRMSGNYWEAATLPRYYDYLQELVGLGVIEVDHFYSKKLGIPKGYRFKKEIAEGSPVLMKFTNKAERNHDLDNPIIKRQIRVLKQIKTTYRTEKQMVSICDNEINIGYLKRNGLSIGYIPDGNYRLIIYERDEQQYRPFSPHARSHQFIIAKAFEKELTPILWKHKVYLVPDVSEWIKYKCREIKTHLMSNLVKFRYISNAKNITASINDTNERFDTNVTNVSSVALKYLRLDGQQLMSVDAKNFQLTIFSNVLKALNKGEGKLYDIVDKVINKIKRYSIGGIRLALKERKTEKEVRDALTQLSELGIDYQQLTDSYKIKKIEDVTDFLGGKKTAIFRNIDPFCTICNDGRFYENCVELLYESRYKGYLCHKESLDQATDRELKIMRNDAKSLTFKTIFPHYKKSNDLKKALKEKYPEAIEFIDLFKKRYGSRFFSIFLQLIESHIFVQNILKTLLEKRYKVFGKHDAILFKKSDYVAVMEIMYQQLDLFLDGYKVSIENI